MITKLRGSSLFDDRAVPYLCKGALVKIQKTIVLKGSNQLRVDMQSLTNGVYSLFVDWNTGQMKKTVQVLKQ